MTPVLGLALSMISVPSPQAEYDAYVATFSSRSFICGAIEASGGPVGQPTVSTFRLWPGGRYDAYFATKEEHSDGKQLVTYSAEVNKFVQGPCPTTAFAIFFGPRFGGVDQRIVVASVKDGTFDGRAVRVFRLKLHEGEQASDLFVRKDKNLPVALMSYGQQASYTTAIPEIHLDRKATFKPWSPPNGATLTDFLPGD